MCEPPLILVYPRSRLLIGVVTIDESIIYLLTDVVTSSKDEEEKHMTTEQEIIISS